MSCSLISYAHGLEPPRVIGQTLILPSFKDDNEEDECRQIFSHRPSTPCSQKFNYDLNSFLPKVSSP
ncbi:hypothetical protein Leryth_005910 [Lithospermum erythrorhizon]|nr:hypothetical protein Leryth_005910 [Lithospermum erythrorhizon]